MTLHDYLRILRERWVTVLVVVLVALVGASAIWYFRPKEYTAHLTMYVSAQTADSAQSAYQGAQLSQQRVTSYVELVNSTRVTQQVVRELGLDELPSDLAERINASSALDSVLIDVAVTEGSPQRATEIADAIGRVFIRVVDDLERPTDPGARPPVAVRVVQPAEADADPSSANLPITLAIGLLAGLAVGVVTALVRSILDNSMKSPDQLREASRAPNLGTIAFDPKVPKHPLTVHEDPQSPRSEAFRQLRTNLQFVDVDQPRRVIAVTSSLPSEGKTTTLANLAIALASAGHRVLVVEADLRRPKLADLLGLDRAVGLTSVLSGRVSRTQAVQHWSGGVDLLASGPLPPNPSELLASQQMMNLLREAREEYDVVLLDTPPLLPVADAAAVAPSTDGVILICRFKKTNRDQVGTAVQGLEAVSASLLGTVLTMVPATGPRAYARYNSYYLSEQPAAPISPSLGNVAVSRAGRRKGRGVPVSSADNATPRLVPPHVTQRRPVSPEWTAPSPTARARRSSH